MFSKPRQDILKTSVVDITGKFILFIPYNLFEVPPKHTISFVLPPVQGCKLPVYTCKMAVLQPCILAVYNLVFWQFTLPYIQVHLFWVHIYCTIFTIVYVIFILEAY